jgi:hypothetical protein
MLPWAPPDAFDGVTPVHLMRVQNVVSAGDWKQDPQAEDWVGLAVADVLSLDVSDRKGAGAAKVKALLKQWMANGRLKVEKKRCPKARRDKPFVVVGEPVEPD